MLLFFHFRYRALGLTEGGHAWKLFFKIFCFLQPELVEVDSVEYGFLYEQVSKKHILSVNEVNKV